MRICKNLKILRGIKRTVGLRITSDRPFVFLRFCKIYRILVLYVSLKILLYAAESGFNFSKLRSNTPSVPACPQG
ncbi:MAG: hypothetical protein HC817_08230 [Saprospiraceae bacterium]|nr:hypothetical protein [Saprospiraceae bacterium]